MEMNIARQFLQLGDKRIDAASVKSVMSEGLDCVPEYLADLYRFLDEWFSSSETVEVHTSGSTGTPKTMHASKYGMMNSAVMTCSYLGLHEGDTALLCMNLKYIGAKMMVVRAMVWGLNLIVKPADGHPFAGLDEHIDFAAVVPMQLYNTFSSRSELSCADDTSIIIVGGGAISPELDSSIQALSGRVYSTYGMTETLSHIALRKLNGPDKSEKYYPLEGVSVSLSDEDTLVINAPAVCNMPLRTNDIVEIDTDGGFTILGRLDNVINSGGIKIYPEQVENMLSAVVNVPFVITSVPDGKFGEAVVLIMQGDNDTDDELIGNINSILPKYYRPHHIVHTDAIPMTPNGKTARAECRKLARLILSR